MMRNWIQSNEVGNLYQIYMHNEVNSGIIQMVCSKMSADDKDFLGCDISCRKYATHDENYWPYFSLR